jgi:hypothetical protein
MWIELSNKANSTQNVAFDFSQSKNRNCLNRRDRPRNQMKEMGTLKLEAMNECLNL